MQRLLRLVSPALAALAVLAAAGCEDESRVVPAASATAVVGSVTDGDTLRLVDGRRIRLVQIDAPEQGECFHDGATRELRRLAPPGSRVSLAADPRLDRVDAYGRLLRYVLTGGTNVNLTLVERGAATPYFFRGERGLHARALLTAARSARGAGRGLWAACPRARLDPGRGALTGPGRRG